MIDKRDIDLVKTKLSEARKHKTELEETFRLAEAKRSSPTKTLKRGVAKSPDNGLKDSAEALLMENYKIECLSRKVKLMERQNEVETAELSRKR